MPPNNIPRTGTIPGKFLKFNDRHISIHFRVKSKEKTTFFCTKSRHWNWHFLSTVWIFQANFSHRIDKFSFGELHGSIIQPLEGDEKFDYSANNKYQYFIEVCAIYFLLKFRFCKSATKLEEITKFSFESGLL